MSPTKFRYTQADEDEDEDEGSGALAWTTKSHGEQYGLEPRPIGFWESKDGEVYVKKTLGENARSASIYRYEIINGDMSVQPEFAIGYLTEDGSAQGKVTQVVPYYYERQSLFFSEIASADDVVSTRMGRKKIPGFMIQEWQQFVDEMSAALRK